MTVLYPFDAADSPCLPVAVEARSGRAFRIEHGGALDLFAVRQGPQTIAAEGITSDADWLWLRRREGAPDALVIRDATTMALEGAVLLQAPAPVGLALWRTGGDLQVDFTGDTADLDLSCFRSTTLVLGGLRFTMPATHRLRFESGRPKIDP